VTGETDRGMTLLEVLVALMVLALTGMLLSEGLHFGARAWDRAGGRAELAVARFDASQTLRSLVEQAEPTAFPGDGTFEGGAGSLALAVHESARLTGGHGRRIEIIHDDRAQEIRLRLSDPEDPGEVEQVALLNGVADFGIRYFGQDETRSAPEWMDSWPETAAMPLLVEIEVAFADGSPSLIIDAAPRKRVAVECLVRGARACTAAAR